MQVPVAQRLAQMASEPKFIRSNLPEAWTPEKDKAAAKNPNIFCEPGRLSQHGSRRATRAPTAKSFGGESYSSLPPMTAKSIYIEPQFKRVNLPQMIRVNPLQPPTVPRRTVSMQTSKATQHNKSRALKMQRDQFSEFHAIWAEPIYGSPSKKEKYRSNIRAVLKRQFTENEAANKQERAQEVAYTNQVLSQDDRDRLAELDKKIKRLTEGINVTRKNQELLHAYEEKTKLERRETWAVEAALLRMFPINPRQTLK